MRNFTARQVTDEREQSACLDRMFRYKNSYGVSIRDAADLIYSLVNKGWYTLCVLEYDPLPCELAEEYVAKYGRWQHQAGTTVQHNSLGMKWAMHMHKLGLEVTLSDSPDISGYINLKSGRHRLYGDVGQCSLFPAWMDCGRWMYKGDLWINVFDGMEMVLEAQDDIPRAFKF